MKTIRRRRSWRRAFPLLPSPLTWGGRRNVAGLTSVLVLVALLAPAGALAWAPTDPTIAPGVTVGGVAVGGLDRAAAAVAVRSTWDTDLSLKLGDRVYTRQASAAGQALAVTAAVEAAWQVGRSGTAPAATTPVKLTVAANKARVAAWVATVASAAYKAPVNATYKLRRKRPLISSHRSGAKVDTAALAKLVTAALLAAPDADGRSLGRPKVLREVRAATTAKQLPPVLVVDRSDRTVTVWGPRRRIARFRIAVGQSAYPTPLGNFHVVQLQKHPTWTPPNSEWAKDAEPIAPGADNPLGTRWIGTSASGIGFHGTPNEGSVGTAASHGCMRMYRRDVERMFRIVRIGSPVHITG